LKASILDASSLRKTLLRLIPKHDKIYMAVAWADSGPVADQLIENKRKFESVTVGLDFCATDPDFVDALQGVRNSFVFKKQGARFHLKAYLFVTGENAEAIVGSANFTRGGLGSNVEVCVHLRSSVSDPAIASLIAMFDSFAPHRQPVTRLLAESYRRQAAIAAKKPRPAAPVLPTETRDFRRIDSELLKMDRHSFGRSARTQTIILRRG
jgi:HKD family nuclease